MKGLKEVSGKLEYGVGTGSKEVDLGFTDVKEGSRGKEYGAFIESLSESKWQKGHQELSLRLMLARDMIKSVKFFAADGSQLSVKPGGHSSSGKETTMSFSTANNIPAQGRIVLELYEQFQKYEVPFAISNISLLGKPLK